jgi:O-methyltransferase involved in polyketide biosynthesis
MTLRPSIVEETLFIALWCRAHVSTHYPSLLYDAKAVDLVRAIDYDFSVIESRFSPEYFLTSAARARQCDDAATAYVAAHPRASVINLGAGLDTTFYRIDNGSIEWYDLDLPSVIALRKQLLPETDRTHAIAKSLLDVSWYDDVTHTKRGVFAIAGGVLAYLEGGQVKTFLSALADHVPGAEIVFTAYSRHEVSLINKSLQHLGMTHATMKWALEDANDLAEWDHRIVVVDQFSFFRDIPLDPAWGEETIRRIRAVDEQKLMSIVHLRL